jgi:formylglycine-generating enzyme required for sulfatase activity
MTPMIILNRLSVALILIFAVSVLILTSTGARTVLSFQGKGGEVVAKPTPTPKKTTTRTRTNTRSTGSKTGVDELAFWETIKNSTDPEDFKAYLEQYPKGKFAPLARNKLRTLEASQPKTSATPEAPNETSPANTNRAPTTAPKTGTVVKNQMGMEFAYVPPGSFLMGSTQAEVQAVYEAAKRDRSDAKLEWFTSEMPQHQVTIRQGFYMGRFEVTQAQWQEVMKSNPSSFKDCEQCPVENVSWNEAREFLRRMNARSDDFTYRLPSEAEWEYASRAGSTGDIAGNSDAVAWYGKNASTKTHPVGRKQPNAFGLYDMQGNVSEYCEDWYHKSYDGSPTDGSAWLSGGEQKERVLRGGSLGHFGWGIRSSSRYNAAPDFTLITFGFRVVAIPRAQSNSQATNSTTNPSASKTEMPPNPPLPLHSFDFVTVTLDSSGKLKSRETKSENAYTEDLGDGVKLEMVAIPPGDFMMGSPETEPDRQKFEGPQHRVRIGYWFYLGKFETTQAEWRAVMGTSPSSFKDCDECPVEQVSWDDAVEFCRKLSARTGRDYRLPSEAEWEYAARAGTTTPFAFGDTVTPEIVNYKGEYPYGNTAKGTNRERTVPVGSLGVANAFGLSDMHGNVSEWCLDWWHESYSKIAGDAPTDGSAWVSGGELPYQVLRGGSYSDRALNTRSASRSASSPIRSAHYGFRVVAVARTQ